MTEIDPIVEAVFGPAPDGIDLKDSVTVRYNIVSCVVLGLSTVSVALRFYIRTMHNTQMNNLGIDDHTILLGLVSHISVFSTKPIIIAIVLQRQDELVLTLMLTQICTGALVATTLIGRHLNQSHNGTPVCPPKPC